MAASGDTATQSQIASFMKDPKIMAALQARLSDMEGMRSPFFESLPTTMKNRVYAIRNLQKEYIKLESEFYSEVNLLEQKFHKKYETLYAKRLNIIDGSYEPTGEECQHTDDEDDDENENENENDTENDPNDSSQMDDPTKSAADKKDKSDGDSAAKPAPENQAAMSESADGENNLPLEKLNAMDPPFPEDVKGVPEFWSTILRSASTTNELIDDCDEPILKKLTNITLTYLTEDESKTDDQPFGTIGFCLNFHFAENKYFSDPVLKKSYKLRLVPDEDNFMTYEGPEIIECVGCKINWKSDDLNITKTTIKKRQKNKKTGQVRFITTLEAKESFFNYFSSIEEKLNLVRKEADLEDDPEEQETFMREADYEIGHFIRERLIPRAVLYYTGELNDETDDEEEDYDEDDEDDDMDESGEEDADFDPNQAKEQPECKQQ